MESRNDAELNFFIFSNYNIIRACKTYINIFGSHTMPYAFVSFYFNEAQKYSKTLSPLLNSFFEKFNIKSNLLETCIDIFVKSFPNNIKEREISKNAISNLKPSKYLEIQYGFNNSDVSYSVDNDKDLLTALKDIDNIYKRINTNNEVIKIEEQFKNYWKIYQKNEKHKTLIEIAEEKAKKSKESILKRSNSGARKVTKLIIPKYQLPTLYPKSNTMSRVDSLRIAGNFFSSARLLSLLEEYGFKSVYYNSDFVKKRTTLFSPTKSKYSDFF